MTRIYSPDRWVVIEINSEKHGKIRKVFAGWYGGFTSGDAWKLNSGITKVEQDGNFWRFTGESGSVYECHKDMHGMSGYMGGVLQGWQEDAHRLNATIEVVNYEDSFTV